MVLVDPSVPPDRMAELLQCQAGLTPADIGHVFVTHFHHDHRAGLAAFPNARWLMAETEIAWWRGQATPEEQRVLDRMVPAGAEPFPGFQARPAPGHTPGLTALCFAWRGKRVAIAGDAVMTEEYFRAGDVHVKSADFDQARASLHRLGREADLVVPGHDLPFVVAWAG
jgi:glyoxylase-like metal-dependent hydrolase (beta-lactamase superfamily II)